MPRRLQDQPHPHIKLKYGQTVKYTEEKDSSTPLTAARREEKNITRSTWGFPLLWPRNRQHDAHHPWPYHHPTGIPQGKHHDQDPPILDYAATRLDAIITFSARNILLAGHSNASYLSESKACRRVGGHFFLSNNSTKPLNNGSVLTVT